MPQRDMTTAAEALHRRLDRQVLGPIPDDAGEDLLRALNASGFIVVAKSRWDTLTQACRSFSPSIIPELRSKARAVRAERDYAKTSAVYPFDHACDFAELVLRVVGENTGEWWAKQDWSIYDELRQET